MNAIQLKIDDTNSSGRSVSDTIYDRLYEDATIDAVFLDAGCHRRFLFSLPPFAKLTREDVSEITIPGPAGTVKVFYGNMKDK